MLLTLLDPPPESPRNLVVPDNAGCLKVHPVILERLNPAPEDIASQDLFIFGKFQLR
jgi:hypothetical protein